MASTDRHAAGERALRELLADAELPQPDEVEYEEEGIVFLWHDRKLCVVVDLDGAEMDEATMDDAAMDETRANWAATGEAAIEEEAVVRPP